MSNYCSHVNFPPSSYDLIALGYFPWDIVEEKCYADKPEAIEHLMANIREAIADKRPIHSKKCTKIYSIT